MIKTNTNHLYQLQDSDFINYQSDYALIINENIECSILQKQNNINYLITPKEIIYNNQDHKKMIILENINNTYLSIHIPQQGMKGETTYAALQFAKVLPFIFQTKNSLYNKDFNRRLQSVSQNDNLIIETDSTFVNINVSGHVCYNKIEHVIQKDNYLPRKNKEKQLIKSVVICKQKDKHDNLKILQPIAVDVVILNKNKNIILENKSKISKTNNDELNIIEYKYNQNGQIILDQNNNSVETEYYLHGMFGDRNNCYVYSDLKTFYGEMGYCIISWKLNDLQINKLINNQSVSDIYYYKCRYSTSLDKNGYIIWRGWSEQIPFVLNKIPSAPVNLRMQRDI